MKIFPGEITSDLSISTFFDSSDESDCDNETTDDSSEDDACDVDEKSTLNSCFSFHVYTFLYLKAQSHSSSW